MKTVKFNQTAAGSYGVAYEGDEKVVTNKVAEDLSEKGIVDVVGDAVDDEEESKEKESSFSITNNNGKAKEKAEEGTDKANPTGKEKNEKAGPGKTKKK